MQISKIVSSNFKGLWSIGKDEKRDYIKQTYETIYYREAIYHPFSDESPEEIDRNMEEANKNLVCKGGYTYCLSIDFYITKPVLGERLCITKAQYEEISDMHASPHPISMNEPSYFYPTSIKHPQVDNIVNEIKGEK